MTEVTEVTEVMEEKRIYVIVAETVQTSKGTIIQPCGRIAAQCAHVVSKMWSELSRKYPVSHSWRATTTIVLAVPDSASLEVLRDFINDRNRTPFFDFNEEVYGPGAVLTAICTKPTARGSYDSVLGGLPLWSHGQSL